MTLNNKVRFQTLFFIFFLYFLLLTPAYSQKNKKIVIQLKWHHQFQFAGYYAAFEKGYFLDEGLDVEINEADDPESSYKKVLNGEADFGIAMSDLIVLRSKGYPVVAVASIFQHSPLVLITRKDSGIDSIHGLKNKKVMLEGHSAELMAYLKSEGIPASKMIVYPHSRDPGVIVNKEVDAMSAYLTDETYNLLKEGVKYNIFTPRSAGIDFYGDTLFTTEKYIKDNPENVESFLRAVKKGWVYAMNNKNEIARLIFEKYSHNQSVEHLLFEAEQSEKLIFSDVVEIGYMNSGRWQQIADIYANLNMIPRNFSIKGLLYEKDRSYNLKWIYTGFICGFFVTCFVVIVLIHFLRLNRKLNIQIKKRRDVENILRESERRLSVLISNLPGIAYTRLDDKDWTMLFVSRGSYNLTGYKPEGLLKNELVSYGSLIHKEDYEIVFNEVEKAIDDLRPFKIIYRIITKSGETRWMWEQGRGLFFENNSLKFIEGFITDITEQKKNEDEKENLIQGLKNSFNEIKTLRGIIPICSSCKKIRDDKGYWHQVEEYIHEHSDADFSHGICPECRKDMYPGY